MLLVPHAVTLWKGGVEPGFPQIFTSYSEATSRDLWLSLRFPRYLPMHSLLTKGCSLIKNARVVRHVQPPLARPSLQSERGALD